MIEVYYVWKEWVTPEGEDKPRLLTPWSDPYKYEYPFDLLFDSPEEAVRVKREYGAEREDWILCRQTTEPINVCLPAPIPEPPPHAWRSLDNLDLGGRAV